MLEIKIIEEYNIHMRKLKGVTHYGSGHTTILLASIAEKFERDYFTTAGELLLVEYFQLMNRIDSEIYFKNSNTLKVYKVSYKHIYPKDSIDLYGFKFTRKKYDKILKAPTELVFKEVNRLNQIILDYKLLWDLYTHDNI